MNNRKPVLVIAEAGVNHNGDIEQAKKLVDVAAEAGADLVKFQTFKSENIASVAAQKANYQKLACDSSESQKDMLKKLELSDTDHAVLHKHCENIGINFFSTAFDLESLDFLHRLNFEQFKIPSGEITNLPYLRRVASFQRDIILSTGMSSLADIEAAISALEAAGLARCHVTLLHCTSEYPAPFEEVNLLAMKTIGETFDVAVGYSDHTIGTEVAIAAVALGATVIEKHFTLDRSLLGPDHSASLEPGELVSMIRGIRRVERALGTSVKQPTVSESKNRFAVRKSIVAARPIAKGQRFSVDNLAVKRPGTGISPMRWDEVIGKIASRDFEADEEITL